VIGAPDDLFALGMIFAAAVIILAALTEEDDE